MAYIREFDAQVGLSFAGLLALLVVAGEVARLKDSSGNPGCQ